MNHELTVRLEWQAAGQPEFRLTRAAGVAPRIASVSVASVTATTEEDAAWSLVASSFEVLAFTVSEPTEEDIDWLASAEPFDPLEDLPPSDPRHQQAIRLRDSSDSMAVPVLENLVYGLVPDGFRQTAPQGAAAPLVPGQSYRIFAIGPEGFGSLEFRVE